MDSGKKQKVRIFALITAMIIPLLLGGFSALLTTEDMKAFEAMNQPPLAPPGWVFPVVWTALYIIMGIASYLVYTSDAGLERKRKALHLYAAQLLMNFFWSTLFFTYARFLISFLWLMVMWVVILICVIRFCKIRRSAGVMMAMLLAWSTFAAYLNLACYIMSITPAPIM